MAKPTCVGFKTNESGMWGEGRDLDSESVRHAFGSPVAEKRRDVFVAPVSVARQKS